MTGSRRARLVLGAVCAAGLVVLYLPLVLTVVYSFNAGVQGKQSARFTGWTPDGYFRAWADDSLRSAAGTGLAVAAVVAVVSALLGSALGYSLVRHPAAWVRRTLSGLVYLFLIIPEVVFAVSVLQFTSQAGIPLGFGTLVAAHTPTAISVVALFVRTRVLTLDRELEDAGRDLGASSARVAWDIVVPQLLPGVLTGAVLAFVFSFDNLVISTFLTTPEVGTLPVYLYSSLNYGTTPEVYAATTAVLLITVAGFALAGLLHRLSSRRVRPAVLEAS
ncbi:ABC transporter permease subunit [Amycolatopsis ultiminotia]|uniref:ABC transporter permease subunit n=1 Tax=Amycolatopsis ultiminotia TaxID=543629 RepID=A0ABP6W544_9PSEU